MGYRPTGWHLAGYKTKRKRIQELALEGRSAAEIAAVLQEERPGSTTARSEISVAIAPLIRSGQLPSRARRRAVEVGGVRYASLTDAAIAHGISRETARKRLAKGHPGWRELQPARSGEKSKPQ
jgi:hypothetical protein